MLAAALLLAGCGGAQAQESSCGGGLTAGECAVELGESLTLNGTTCLVFDAGVGGDWLPEWEQLAGGDCGGAK